MLREIDGRLPRGQVDIKKVQAEIPKAARAARIARPLFLVGWCLGNAPTPFAWESRYPQRVRLTLEAIGLGAAVIKERYPTLELRVHTTLQSRKFEKVSIEAVGLAGELMKDEFQGRVYERLFGIGVGYEVLVADRARFRYVSCVHVAARADLDREGHVTELSPPLGLVVLRNVGDVTLIDSWFSNREDRGRNVKPPRMVEPPYWHPPGRIRRRVQRAFACTQKPVGGLRYRGRFCVGWLQVVQQGQEWEEPFTFIFTNDSSFWTGSDFKGIDLQADALKCFLREVAEDRGRGAPRAPEGGVEG